MNKIYRIVWSRIRNAFVVVGEIARSRGKSSTTCDARTVGCRVDKRSASTERTAAKGCGTTALPAAILLALASPAFADPAATALPTGGQITAGSGSIGSNGANMTVQQNTDKMIANWQSFDIGSQASVTFNQPSSSSVALNRVLGQDPTQILGRLSANGQVMIVNPAGVVFGAGSQVNVGGITATTLNISDADFLSGNYHFADSGNAAAVENLGHILANGGVVAFIAPTVKNEGNIETPNGSAALVVGNDVTLDFSGDGLVTVTVSQSKLDNLVENKGAIRADNGLVILSAGAASDLLSGVVNNSGIVEAKGLSQQGGRIVLDGGNVTNTGSLDASSEVATGGDVVITGHDIQLTGNSHIDASGATGGGEVLVGGDWQGSNGVHQAATVTMAQGASIDVSATQSGDGGKAVLWSDVHNTDSVTAVNGEIRARGGANGGDGGRIETSGANVAIGTTALVDTRAPSGRNGLWLIDPTDFTITAGGAVQTTSGMGADTLATNLASGNVTITTSASGSENGDITVAADITKSAGADATLTLKAHGSIIQNAGTNISSTSNKLNLVLWADSDATGGGFVQLGGATATTINTNGGHLWMGGGSGSTGWNSLTVGNGYAIGNSTVNSNGIYLDNVTIATGGGNVALYGQSTSGAAVQVGGASGDTTADGIHFSSLHGSSINSGTGTIVLSGKGASTTAGTRSGGVDFANASTPVTHTVTSAATSGNAITITGDTSTASAAQVPGVWLDGVNISASAASGSIVVTGVTGTGSDAANSKAIEQGTYANSAISAAGGNITLTGNTLALTDTSAINNTSLTGTSTSNLFLQPYTSNTTVGLGDDTQAFNIPLTLISSNVTPGFNGITIGSATSGTLTVGSAFSWNGDALTLMAGSGYINVNKAVNWTSAKTLTLSAYRDVAVNDVLSVSGSGNLTVTANTIGASGTYANYLKMQRGSSSFTGKIDWTSSGTLTLNGSAYTAVTNQTQLAAMSGGGKYFLANDIALTGTWTPITSFSGIFNGLGHTLSNLSNGTSSSNDQGLFGTITGATIENVGITSGTITGGNNVGAFVGRVASGGTSYLRNLFTAPGTAGTANVSIEPDGTAQRSYIGGIVGMQDQGNTLYIVDVSNGAYVHSPVGASNNLTNVGGVLGGFSSSTTWGNLYIANATNFGEIVSGTVANKNSGSLLGNNVGGIVGSVNGTVVTFYLQGSGYTTNYGNIYGNSSVAGIVGNVGGATTSSSYSNLKNTGNIQAAYGNVGGLFGYVSNGTSGAVYIDLSANQGTVTCTVSGCTSAGGLAGTISLQGSGSVNIARSFNSGAITSNAGERVGGLAGSIYTGGAGYSPSINDSYNTGAVTGATSTTHPSGVIAVGGIVGEAYGISGSEPTFRRVYNTGTISTGGYGIGTVGTWGLAARVTFSDAYYLAGTNSFGIRAIPGQTVVIGSPISQSSAGLQGSTVFNALNANGYWAQNAAINNNYPYLSQNVPTIPIIIDVNALSKIYGDATPSLSGQYSLTGCSGCITLDWGSFLTASTAAGSYAYSTTNLLALTYVSGTAESYSLIWGGNSFTVNQRPVTLSGSKTYDGSVTTSGTTFTVGGTVNGDTVTVSGGSGILASQNAGSRAITSMDTLALSNSNYTLIGGSGSVTVDAAPLTLSVTKTYDGSTGLGSGTFTWGGLVGSETLMYSGLTLSSKDVATANKYISAITLADGSNGGLASNYQLPSLTSSSANNAVTINPAMLTLSANKTYDGTTSLAGAVTLGGLIGSETLNYSGATASDSHVATADKYISAITLSNGSNGGTASNYQLPTLNAANAPVTINAAMLTPTISNTGVTKVYDGNTSTTLVPTYTFSGLVAGDTAASLSYGTKLYNSKNVSSATTVTVSGLSIAGITGSNGSAASDYVLDSTSKTVAANITAKAVTVSGITTSNKVYDGTTDATVGVGTALFNGMVAGDLLTVSATGAFSDKNVGTGKTVTLSSSYGGADVDNYTFTDQASTTANITARTLNVTYSGVNRVYDGTTDATVTTSDDRVAGDVLTINDTASFSDKNVGIAKTVSVSSASLSGTDKDNYTLASTTGSTTADITAKAVSVSGITASNKVYDGNTDATVDVGSAAFSGMVAGDVLTVSATGAFSDKNVGTGKTVTLSSSYGGADFNNYTFTDQASTTANITARTLNVTYSGVNRVYDGTTDATVTTSDDRVAGDELTINNSASFSDKNVDTGKTVSVSSASLSGTDKDNYTLASTTGSTTADINARALSISGSSADNKVYDGTTDAVVTAGTLSGVIAGDTVSVSATGSFADKNVGAVKPVTAAYTLAGTDGGNYTLANDALSAEITARTLNVSYTGVNRVYDGTTDATVTTSDDRVAGDVLTINNSASFSDKNVDTGKTVSVSSAILSGTDKDNYTLASTTGSTTADITPKSLTVTGITASDKVYDGTTDATVDASGASFSGMIGGDDVTINAGTIGGSFADKNVGTGKAINLTGITLGGTDASNYTLSGVGGVTADISQKAITVSGITAADKVYDGTTTATVDGSAAVFTGMIAGDDLSVSATGAFVDKNVDTGKIVALSGATYGGADAGNYSYTDQASTTADITARTLNVTYSGVSRVYDGTTDATVTTSDDRVAGDVLTLSEAASFADKNVGTGKSVSVTSASISGGADASNYVLASATGSTTADITAKAITVSGLTAVDKVYDGTTTATVDGSAAVFTGMIAGDDLSVSAIGAFADKNVGTGKSVALSGATYGGADAGNYSYTDQANATADITAKAVTVSGLTAGDKVYDGTTTATVNTGGASFGGMVAGDALSVSATGAFSDKNVGTGKTVTLSSSYGGADVDNYTFTDQASTTADIMAKSLGLDLQGQGSRVYDGTTSISLSGVTPSLTGVIAGDTVTTDTGTVTGFVDKNVGANKAVTFTGFGLQGADAVNYSLVSGSAPSTANITPRTLTLSYSGVNRAYDGTTVATVNIGDDRIAGDALSFGYSASFGDKNVGTGKSVVVTGVNISGGADADNYVLASSTGSTTADITARLLTLLGLTAENKIYDGNTDATISSYGSLSGIVAGDDIALDYSGATASFADPNPGTGKTVIVASLQLAGLDIGNYALPNQTTTADISSTENPPSPPKGEPGDPPGPKGPDDDPFNPKPPIDTGDPGVPPGDEDTGNDPGKDSGGGNSSGDDKGSGNGSGTGNTDGKGSDVRPDGYLDFEGDGSPEPISLGYEGDTAVLVIGTGQPYIVGEGNSLWRIARSSQVYGDGAGWPRIYKANGDQISDPNMIYPGQQLRIEHHGVESVAFTVPVFTQQGDSLVVHGAVAVNAYRVEQQDNRWAASPAATPDAVAPAIDLEGARFVTAAVTLPSGIESKLRVGITKDGVLLVQAAEEVNAAYDERHILLLAVVLAKHRLDVKPETITAVVLQS